MDVSPYKVVRWHVYFLEQTFFCFWCQQIDREEGAIQSKSYIKTHTHTHTHAHRKERKKEICLYQMKVSCCDGLFYSVQNKQKQMADFVQTHEKNWKETSKYFTF